MTFAKLRLPAVLAVSFLLVASSRSSARSTSVRLLRPDSLAGWDHGAPQPAGWTIAEGRLAGRASSTPLLSGWTFGDFQLRWRWSVEQDGQLIVSFPKSPSGEGLTLTLCEGDGCGRLTAGQTELASGAKVASRKPGRMHAAEIRRRGSRFSITIDGRQIHDVEIDAAQRFGLGLAVTRGSAAVADFRLEEPPGAAMFNGQNFDDFYTNGDITQWAIQGDQVTMAGNPHDYLRTKKQYANFTWSMELMLRRGGNSGLGIRTPHDGWPTTDGMELQLLDTPYDAQVRDQPFMAVYGHVLPLDRADKSQKWNRIVIKMEGYMLTTWVNGRMVQHVNTFHHPELRHRLLRGWLGFQDHGAWIRVRNAHILEGPNGLGMAAWSRGRPRGAITTILDRLLNRDPLSIADGLTSAVAMKVFNHQEPAEVVLAELTGPGAVTRIARTGGDGQLAFYFDGEKEPRLQCAAGELAQTLPRIGVNSNPLLTCLTYRKGLKIVLREARSGDYRIDYVRTPGHLACDSFVDVETTFPRGWLNAAATHLRWFGSGRYHGHNRLPRFRGQPKTIEPGQSVELVHVDGAGIVESLTLATDKRVLENNDLWLELTVDGENSPAVSAPARFLFPALTRNWGNYVLQDRGGPTNMLAAPFSAGVTIAAVNRGGRPIKDLAAVISVRRTSEKDANRRMRLRGVFQEAGDSGRIIDRQGAGRLVGLVYQLVGDESPGVNSLLVDGGPTDGWSAGTLDPLLGGQGEFRKHLTGRQGSLAWRYFLLAPVEFKKSLVLSADRNQVGQRLALFYLTK